MVDERLLLGIVADPVRVVVAAAVVSVFRGAEASHLRINIVGNPKIPTVICPSVLGVDGVGGNSDPQRLRVPDQLTCRAFFLGLGHFGMSDTPTIDLGAGIHCLALEVMFPSARTPRRHIPSRASVDDGIADNQHRNRAFADNLQQIYRCECRNSGPTLAFLDPEYLPRACRERNLHVVAPVEKWRECLVGLANAERRDLSIGNVRPGRLLDRHRIRFDFACRSRGSSRLDRGRLALLFPGRCAGDGGARLVGEIPFRFQGLFACVDRFRLFTACRGHGEFDQTLFDCAAGNAALHPTFQTGVRDPPRDPSVPVQRCWKQSDDHLQPLPGREPAALQRQVPGNRFPVIFGP